MSKERLEEANEWLKSMYEILSTKTEVEDIEYMQKRIDLFEWMRSEIYRIYGGETFTGYKERVQELEEDKKVMQLNLTKFVKDIKRLEERNERYRQYLKEANSIIFEAKESLNKGEKINGLGYLYMAINQALEGEE